MIFFNVTFSLLSGGHNPPYSTANHNLQFDYCDWRRKLKTLKTKKLPCLQYLVNVIGHIVRPSALVFSTHPPYKINRVSKRARPITSHPGDKGKKGRHTAGYIVIHRPWWQEGSSRIAS